MDDMVGCGKSTFDLYSGCKAASIAETAVRYAGIDNTHLINMLPSNVHNKIRRDE